ncbi:MAG TPA: hypothetical protein VGB88_00870 [Alphaproteobacteria bacterium]
MAIDDQMQPQGQHDLLDSFIRLIAAAIDATARYTGGHCAGARDHGNAGGRRLCLDHAAEEREQVRACAGCRAAALAAYRARRWTDREHILRLYGERACGWPIARFYDMLSGRIAGVRARSPGADGDGVTVAATKWPARTTREDEPWP